MSTCPECGGELTARCGEVVTWHWAHRPKERRGCWHSESEWHLGWKAAYESLPGWIVEAPLQIGGRTFRADAMNPRTGAVREFVHSLSPAYIEKHRALAAAGLDVLWIFDGVAFGSRRVFRVRGGEGRARLLTPRAAALHSEIGGLVHHGGRLWRHWRDGIWFPCNGPAAQHMLRAYQSATAIPQVRAFLERRREAL